MLLPDAAAAAQPALQVGGASNEWGSASIESGEGSGGGSGKEEGGEAVSTEGTESPGGSQHGRSGTAAADDLGIRRARPAAAPRLRPESQPRRPRVDPGGASVMINCQPELLNLTHVAAKESRASLRSKRA